MLPEAHRLLHGTKGPTVRAQAPVMKWVVSSLVVVAGREAEGLSRWHNTISHTEQEGAEAEEA